MSHLHSLPVPVVGRHKRLRTYHAPPPDSSIFHLVELWGLNHAPRENILSYFLFKLWLAEVLVTGSLMPSDTCLYSRAGNNIRLECSVPLVCIFMITWLVILAFPFTVVTFIKQSLLESRWSNSFHPPQTRGDKRLLLSCIGRWANWGTDKVGRQKTNKLPPNSNHSKS